ncbi:NRAMP family divalent metal transporter [Acidiphilium sp. C61]|jgi:NRAMP (natural resistance-associated macrophage protein)-like metal ion transporter|uniref:NRAMP family divalent metal transporter n=1 Tax=Acidiphilium sp. C61 TaxID=1671485 RepID=UPI00157B0E24|nr:divalent metal cation transporter [Acidiphilium sp. C61]
MNSTPARPARWLRVPRALFARLGPGLITGAADDDPSGIATYSQVGAQFGYTLGWSVVLALPFMVAVQEISARIGRITGRGLGAAMEAHLPRPLALSLILLLAIANVFNLGADLGAMAQTAHMLAGGPERLYTVAIAIFCVIAEIRIPYRRYVTVLKFLTAALLAYVALLFVLRLPAREILAGALIPRLTLDRPALLALIAVFGTTISPYLFFWQAAEEAEDAGRIPADGAAVAGELARIRVDTWAGMTYSNAVSLSIIIGTAATLHVHGITDIASAADAASALAPIAGSFARLVFALGIFGTGLLAIPVLAGSTAYAIGEALHWTVGLSRRALEARAFYGVLAVATLAGVGIVFSPLPPIRALFWAAVINGIAAVPIIAAMVALASRPAVMDGHILPRWLRVMGWLTAALMGACTLAMLLV